MIHSYRPKTKHPTQINLTSTATNIKHIPISHEVNRAIILLWPHGAARLKAMGYFIYKRSNCFRPPTKCLIDDMQSIGSLSIIWFQTCKARQMISTTVIHHIGIQYSINIPISKYFIVNDLACLDSFDAHLSTGTIHAHFVSS